MSDDCSRNFKHCYESTFDDSLRKLGLTRNSPFWKQVEANLDFDPFNVYSREVPESDGFWLYPTEPAHPDIPALYLFFSVERGAPRGKIHYYAVEKATDWLYPP